MLVNHRINKLFFLIGLIVLVWSFIGHVDFFAWASFTALVIIGSIIVVLTYKRFTFSTFMYAFGLFWAIILLIGAKYTYTTNPCFDWIQTNLNWSRNHYDRFAHFFQGFIPFMIFREWFIRKGYLKDNLSSVFILIIFVLGTSAFYEFLEYLAAIVTNKPPEYILGLQGDVWDTQNDMLMATLGAIVSYLALGRVHGRIISKMMKYDNQKKEEIQ